MVAQMAGDQPAVDVWLERALALPTPEPVTNRNMVNLVALLSVQPGILRASHQLQGAWPGRRCPLPRDATHAARFACAAGRLHAQRRSESPLLLHMHAMFLQLLDRNSAVAKQHFRLATELHVRRKTDALAPQ